MYQFILRARFDNDYPTTMTPAEFVNELFANSGITPTQTELAKAIGEFNGAPNTREALARARALRDVAENPAFIPAGNQPRVCFDGVPGLLASQSERRAGLGLHGL